MGEPDGLDQIDPMSRLRLERDLVILLDQIIHTDAQKAARPDWGWFNTSIYYGAIRLHPSLAWGDYARDQYDDVERSLRAASGSIDR